MAFTTDEIKAVINNIGHSSTQPAVNNILTSHGITIQTLRSQMLAQIDEQAVDLAELDVFLNRRSRWERFYGPSN